MRKDRLPQYLSLTCLDFFLTWVSLLTSPQSPFWHTSRSWSNLSRFFSPQSHSCLHLILNSHSSSTQSHFRLHLSLVYGSTQSWYWSQLSLDIGLTSISLSSSPHSHSYLSLTLALTSISLLARCAVCLRQTRHKNRNPSRMYPRFEYTWLKSDRTINGWAHRKLK